MPTDYVALARRFAQMAGIDPDLFVRQINQESGFNPRAGSPAGAHGIAQIVPKYHPGVDAWDPVASLQYAANWMKDLLHQYGGDWAKALVHYNGGGGAVQAYLAGHPYDESKAYLMGILGDLGPRKAEAAGDEPPPIHVYRSGSSDEVDPNTPGLESSQGGAQVVQAQQQTPPQTKGAEILQQIVNKKGKQPISATARDEKIKNPKPPTPIEEARGTYSDQVANPSPTYRYLWDDGTYLDVKTTQDPSGTGPEASKYEVVGGTALASVAREDKQAGGQIIGGNSPNEQWIVVVKPDGTIEQKPNPNYVPPKPEKPATPRTVPTAANEPYIVQEMPDGTTRSVPNPNYAPPKPDRPTVASVSGPYIVQQMADGSIQTVPNPNYQAPRATGHVADNRVVTIGPDGQMVGSQVIDPAAQALAEEKARRDLMGQQQLLVQNHFALLRDLHTKVAAGEMTPEEADQYITRSKAYTDAALQGTTPFQLAKQAEDAARAAREQGISLINQRLSTGSSLANSLVSAATGLVGGGALPVPGHGPYGIDPLAYSKSFLDDPSVGGGPEVSDFARRLLLGSRPLPAGL